MSLIDRSIGSELSVVEKELIFNEKYANTGFVEYDSKNGEFFFLHPSPFLKTPKREIYHISVSPPPKHQFVEVGLVDERQEVLDNFGEKWINVKEVDRWKLFDPSPLAEKRKIMDYREIIEFFTYPYKGEEENVEEIAGCTSLFAFSSPPDENSSGGINSAILGNDSQWRLFNKPLQTVPNEFRRKNADYYYYISKIERVFKKVSRENNIAILRPKSLLSDLPIVILDETQKKISKQFIEQLEIESKIVTAHLLDALLLQPHATKKVEKMMYEKIVEIREEYYSAGLLPFNQNIGGAVPKLASSYCRLQSSLDIQKKDVDYVVDLWFSMRRRAEKLADSPMKQNHMLELTTDARTVFLKLYDIFGADTEISMAEAIQELRMDPKEFELAVDSLINKGYCVRRNNFITLLEPYKKQILKSES
ncbi:MAG: hypothetical protein M0Q91_04780 [Methanoregula sp.]|jgi:hypothetical protein|nr:hypothetical protein [Methanoregula sp.]